MCLVVFRIHSFHYLVCRCIFSLSSSRGVSASLGAIIIERRKTLIIGDFSRRVLHTRRSYLDRYTCVLREKFLSLLHRMPSSLLFVFLPLLSALGAIVISRRPSLLFPWIISSSAIFAGFFLPGIFLANTPCTLSRDCHRIVHVIWQPTPSLLPPWSLPSPLPRNVSIVPWKVSCSIRSRARIDILIRP